MARRARYLDLMTYIDRAERTLIGVGTNLARLYHNLGFTMEGADSKSPSEPQADPHWSPFPW